MHKFLSVVLIASICVSLCACESNNGSKITETSKVVNMRTPAESTATTSESTATTSDTSAHVEPVTSEICETDELFETVEQGDITITSPTVPVVTSEDINNQLQKGTLYAFQIEKDGSYSVFWLYTVNETRYFMIESWIQNADKSVSVQWAAVTREDGATVTLDEVLSVVEATELKLQITGGTMSEDTLLLTTDKTGCITSTPMSKLGLLSFEDYDTFYTAVQSFSTESTYFLNTSETPTANASATPFAVSVDKFEDTSAGFTYTTTSGDIVPVSRLRIMFWYVGYFIQEDWYLSYSDSSVVAASSALVVADNFSIDQLETNTCSRFKSSDWVFNEGGYYEPAIGQGTSIMEPDLIGKTIGEAMTILNNQYNVSYVASCDAYNDFAKPSGGRTGMSYDEIKYKYAGYN